MALTVYVANVFTGPEEDPSPKAAAQLDEARKRGWDAALKQSTAKWAKFWEQSFVHLNSSAGAADYMANLWYLHLYWMGCSSRGEFPIKFNGGLFLTHRDSRSWGGCYWYQNTREPYWPLLATNHIELCPPLHRLYRSVLPVEMEMTKRLFQVDGAWYQETMAIDSTRPRTPATR